MPDPIKIPKVYLQLADEKPSQNFPGRPVYFCAAGDPETGPSTLVGYAADDAGAAILDDACDAYNAQRNAEET